VLIFPSTKEYIPGLDGLRALAVVLVMAYHVGILSDGWIGVQIFFVLSGFLITRILLVTKQQANFFWPFLANFYARRSLRIFPLYYLYIGFFLLAQITTGSFPEITRWLPWLLLYGYNFVIPIYGFWIEPSTITTHLWSLCVEEQYYLLYPPLLFFLPLKGLKRALLGLIFTGPLFRWIAMAIIASIPGREDLDIGQGVYHLSTSHFDAFALGGLLSLNPGIFASSTWLGLFCSTSSLLVLLGYLRNIWYPEPSRYLFSFGYQCAEMYLWKPIWSYSLINFWALSLIALIITQKGQVKRRITRIFEFRPFIELGKVSYGMYIYHFCLFTGYVQLARKIGGDWGILLFFPMYVLTVYCIASASFELVERRFLRLKKYFELGSEAKRRATNLQQ